MLEPISPSHSLRQVYPLFLPESRVYQASVQLARQAKPTSGEVTPTGGLLPLSVSQINNLFLRFKLQTLTFQDLQAFPMSQLSPREKEFVRFLQLNPGIFKALAKLDHQPDTLSMQDIKIAAQLAGDALMLSAEDLAYLRQSTAVPAVKTSTPQTAPALPVFKPEDLNALLRQLDLQGKPLAALAQLELSRLKLPSAEMQMLRFLQSAPAQKLLYNITLPYGGLLLPDVMRILASLIWNPAILGAAPIVFLKSPGDGDDEEVEEVLPMASVDGVRPKGQRRVKGGVSKRQVPLRAAGILRILRQLNPEDGHVTLAQLRGYEPRDAEEARLLNTLKQAKVFELLASQDEEAQTLSPDDVKLALSEDALVVYDPYLVLVVLP